MDRDPEQIARLACRWIAADRCRWWALIDLCLWSKRVHPSHRIRRGDIWVRAQERGLSVTLCEAYRFDNTLWAPLSRYAIMCCPELATHIHTRASGIDSIDLRAIWAEVVGNPSCLVHDDWRRATCKQASPSKAACPA